MWTRSSTASCPRRHSLEAFSRVGKDGALVHLRSFGRLSYDSAAAAVEASTIYDLASLTKVIATTTMAMILVDEGRLSLDKPVRDFIPAFHGGDKDAVTVRHLLTHSSGVDWWAPLYRDLRTREAFLSRIVSMDLKFVPGTKSVYSDLGILVLGEILERVAGEPLPAFVKQRVFDPLGLQDTQFRPPAALLPRIRSDGAGSVARPRRARRGARRERLRARCLLPPKCLIRSAPGSSRWSAGQRSHLW